jgi:hypothetical protein
MLEHYFHANESKNLDQNAFVQPWDEIFSENISSAP